MMNRIAEIATEAHRVNRERFKQGYRYPSIHDTDEQRALNDLFRELSEEARAGHRNMHVVHYLINVEVN